MEVGLEIRPDRILGELAGSEPGVDLVIGGEIVALDDKGRSSFQLLQGIRVTAGFREGKNVFKNNDIVEVQHVTDSELVLNDADQCAVTARASSGRLHHLSRKPMPHG